MVTLSGKLAGITLLVVHFGSHLNTQGKVINLKLALQNFRYAGESLCDIWHKDLIFGKSVNAWYVKEFTNPFENIEFEGTDKEKEEGRKQQKKKQQDENDILECFVPWSWIENHCNLCQYSLNIKHCTNASCCEPPCVKEATELLLLNNSFLPPIMKAKDRHFINPIHLLEYYDLLKIPRYDSHCPSLDQTTYPRFYYTVYNNTFQLLLI
ncbi:hypothetical protein RclHR1_13020001 [Rhizophagus clarus]|nr:hypothetical protein RclHR1_13020001 [Rhizophagus clarus]